MWGRQRDNWAAWILLIICIMGAILGLYQLSTDSLWLDETTTGRYIQADSIPGVLENLDNRSGRPLHFVIVYLMKVFGQNEFWLRLPSVIFGVLSLGATYLVGREIFGKQEGLLGAFLLALSPFFLRYSQEARSYTMFMFLSLLSLFFFLKAWRSTNWRWWIGFTIVSILNTYTHYFATFVLGAELIVAGGLWVYDFISFRRLEIGERNVLLQRLRRSLIGLSLSLGGIALAYLPSLAHLEGFLSNQGGGNASTPRLDLSLEYFISSFNSFSFGVRSGNTLSFNAGLIIAFVLIGLIVMSARRHWRALFLILIFVGLPFLVLYLVPRKHPFFLRYVIYVLPVLMLTAAAGITGIIDLLKYWLESRLNLSVSRNFQILSFGLIVLAFTMLSIKPIQDYYAYNKQPWRDLAPLFNSYVAPGEVVIVEPAYFAKPLDYYGMEFAQTPRGSLDKFISISEQSTGIWYLFSKVAAADPSGSIEEWVKKNDYSVLLTKKMNTSGLYLYYINRDPYHTRDLYSLPMLENIRNGVSNASVTPAPPPHIQAEKYKNEGQYDLAIAAYKDAIELYPRDSAAWIGLGDLYSEQEQWENAAKAYREATQLLPTRGDLLGSLCASYLKMNADYAQEALEACQQAAALYPSSAWYKILLGDALVGNHNPDQALIEYKGAARLEPNYEGKAWYYLRLGEAYRLSEEIGDAIEAYVRVLELAPGNQRALNKLKDLCDTNSTLCSSPQENE